MPPPPSPASPPLLALLLGLALGAAACRPSEPPPPPPEPPPLAPPALRVDTASVVEADPALRYQADLQYPELAPAERPAVQRVNRALREAALALAHDVRPDSSDFTGDPAVDRWVMGEVQGGFGPTLLADDVFSTLLRAAVFTGGAHGAVVAVPLTFDLRTGARVELRDLFRAGAAWLDTLAALATADLAAHHDGADWLYDGAVPPLPEAFSAFALRPDSLLVFFPPSSVAPYAFGASEVRLPYRRIRHLLRPGGPAARLLPPEPEGAGT